MTGTGIRYAARTHVGRVRKLNEDSLLSLPDLGVWVVADGMGGHAGGDFASQTIIEAMATIRPDLEGADVMVAVRAALVAAHDQIVGESHRRGGTTMGSTVVALILSGDFFACLWAGDSRLYLARGAEIRQLTDDHSLVAELVASGQLSPAEAERHPQANVITRAVGVGEVLELDKVRGEVQRGDRFLICTDGLTRYADAGLLGAMLASRSIEAVADALIDHALAQGGEDNVSAILIDIL